MKVGIFCSANNDIDPDFFSATAELGKWLAEKGHTIVYGGSNQGLMECIARAAHDAGGRIIGVIPEIIERGGKKSDYVDVEIPCDSLTDRKELMMTQADVFVVLPGGIGTLDEMFTVAASATIGYHKKRVIVYNMKGFWTQLVALLDDLAERGFIRGSWHDHISVARNLEDIAGMLTD